MTRNGDRSETAQRESARKLAMLSTAIGLCLAVPVGAAVEPTGVQHLAARPEAGAVLLTWTVPRITTYSRVVIRFQADGPAPSSPSAGSPLFDEPTLPGAMYGTRHSGLSPRHTYSYAVFALDPFGVVRASTTAVSTPLPLEPPGTVKNVRRVDLGGAPCATPAVESGK
jgi:hypothetical protein